MAEQEWLAGNDPKAMLDAIRGKVSDRKLRLFGCACVRQVWNLLIYIRSRQAVETAEKFADGIATLNELERAREAARSAARDAVAAKTRGAVKGEIRSAAWSAESVAWSAESAIDLSAAWFVAWNASIDAINATDSPTTRDAARKTQADLLRDIVGNPWRPITLPSHWLTPDVKALAQAAYEELIHAKIEITATPSDCSPDSRNMLVPRNRDMGRLGSQQFVTLQCGHLDPDRLLILADALEDAGCDCEEILRHLRRKTVCHVCNNSKVIEVPLIHDSGDSPDDRIFIVEPTKTTTATCPFCTNDGCGPHVRGCWVVDLLLGKE